MENFESKKRPAQEKIADTMELLSQYAREHYGQYTDFPPDTLDLINKIGENREKFENETFPNASSELVGQVEGFIRGALDEEIIALLKRLNFDYQGLLDSEEDEETKVRVLLEAVLKAQSYDKAVEQNRDNEVGFFGFEDDPDISDAKEFIYGAFGNELLQKCLVSNIEYQSDIVNVQIDGTDYWLPIDVYKQWEQAMPQVKQRKFRAESFVKWNTDPNFSKKFIPTPINFYSFHGEQPETLDYLANVPNERKMRIYKLGTITHEIAHHAYDYLMDADKRVQWQRLVDDSQPITTYAESYTEGRLKYDEFFAEAVRLKTTVPDYLKTNFSEINQFLNDNFPSIQYGDQK